MVKITKYDFPLDLNGLDLKKNLPPIKFGEFQIPHLINYIPPKNLYYPDGNTSLSLSNTNSSSQKDDHFERTIDYALTQVPMPMSQNARVLSIGTGYRGMEEYHAFLKHFWYVHQVRLAEYVSIDQKTPSGISYDLLSQFDRARSIVNDARNLDQLVGGTFDVVVLTHPEPETRKSGPEEYKTIFEKAKGVMHPHSRMVITSFWEHGYNVLLSILNECSFNIKNFEENPHKGKMISSDGKVVYDKYLIVATK